MKLIIKNKGNEGTDLRVLFGYSANDENFGFPEFIQVSIESDIKDLTYKKLLQHLGYKSVVMKFFESTNNRHMFFWYMNAHGTRYPMEPSLNADGTKRPVWKGKKVPFFGEDVYEGDLFETEYTNKWNPKKWNIADTHEECLWTFSNFIYVFVEAKKEFEIEFEIING